MKDFEQPFYDPARGMDAGCLFVKEALSLQTADKAKGFEVISIFPGDEASDVVLDALYKNGVRFIAVRGEANEKVDLEKAKDLGLKVAHVPAQSPHAVAEHTVALILALNRNIIAADRQVHQQNFTSGNLVGFDLHDKTVGIIGVGKIGSAFVKIMHGFGCRLIAYDIQENKMLTTNYGLEYVDLPALCREADIISIHTGLTPHTKQMVNKKLIGLMKRGVMLINTGSGECVITADIISGLENGHIGYFGADVYENEGGVFFFDHSNKELTDGMLKKLLAMPNVLITPHQAFITRDTLSNMAATTFYNMDCWKNKQRSKNELSAAAGLADAAR